MVCRFAGIKFTLMLRCIAIDDEPLALHLLADNIGKVPFLELVATCGDAFEAARVLQEKEVVRIGESNPRKIDVRVIAATNKDLFQFKIIRGLYI